MSLTLETPKTVTIQSNCERLRHPIGITLPEGLCLAHRKTSVQGTGIIFDVGIPKSIMTWYLTKRQEQIVLDAC